MRLFQCVMRVMRGARASAMMMLNAMMVATHAAMPGMVMMGELMSLVVRFRFGLPVLMRSSDISPNFSASLSDIMVRLCSCLIANWYYRCGSMSNHVSVMTRHTY